MWDLSYYKNRKDFTERKYEMRSLKEINKQIKENQSKISQLYDQIRFCENSIEHLKNERDEMEKAEEEAMIDEWLNENFGIPSQKEARKKSIFIVFDKKANFVKTVVVGDSEEFHYTSPAEEKDTLEHWLKENKLYAHRASSFCDRNKTWYELSFKEQLKNLGWEIDGTLKNTQW